MRTNTKRLLSVFAATALLGATGAPAAMADDHSESTTLEAHLTELNDSGVTSTAWLTLEGHQLHVKIESSGLLAEAPHAQHIHIGGKNMCPDPSMEGSGVDGAIRTTDAAGDYGAVAVSLTKEPGGTGPDSALDVDNFPMGDETYERTLEVPDDVASSLRNGDGSVVLHGVDHNGNGTYDGEQMSDLDPSLPSEATDPAACGALDAGGSNGMPSTGVANVPTAEAGPGSVGLAAGGALVVVAAAGAVVLFNRRAAAE